MQAAKIIEKSFITLQSINQMSTQLILVILLCVAAALFLGLRFYKMLSRKGSGGDCPNCGLDDSKAIKKSKTN
jgi:hypothetical protein